MGIKGAQRLLQNVGAVTIHNSLRDYLRSIKIDRGAKPVIAIDFRFYQNRFSRNPLGLFLKQIKGILKDGAIPLYVIDGQYPEDKAYVVLARSHKRQNRRHCVKLREHDTDRVARPRVTTSLLTTLFQQLHIPYIEANGEADPLCAKLVREKVAISCMSDDTDLLCYGCSSTIHYLPRERIREYNMNTVLDTLGLSQDQMVELGIALGCEYTRFLAKKKVMETYEFMRDHDFSIISAVRDNPTVFTYVPERKEVETVIKRFELPSCLRADRVCVIVEKERIDIPQIYELLDSYLLPQDESILDKVVKLAQRDISHLAETGKTIQELEWLCH